MKKNSTYMTRALQASDRRFSLVLGKMGHKAPLLPTVVPSKDELTALRAQYLDVVGKKPFHGWDAATLKTKIAEAGK